VRLTLSACAAALSAPALLTVLWAAPATAQMGPPKLDQNGDGKVLYAEYRSENVDKTLQRLDSDKNGQVSRAEFDKVAGMARTFGGAKAEAAMSQIWRTTDVNGDGSMSRSELETASKRRFDAADSNRDGALDKTEVAAMRQRQRVATSN
jgi:Ca2+-binding EF-hand superfamily protein